MALFSRAKETEKASPAPASLSANASKAPIPPEILSAVRVRGEAERTPGSSVAAAAPTRPTQSGAVTPPPNLPTASASSSPFLSGLPVKTQTEPSAASLEAPSETPVAGGKTVPAPPALPERRNSFPPASGALKDRIVLKPEAPGKKRLIILVIGLSVLLFGAGAGYYYWQNRAIEAEPLPTPSTETPGTTNPTPVVKTLPYALDRPNYLSLDTETADTEAIKRELDQVANRLIEANISEPIEFVVTDRNNNPLAFSRFAYLLELALPEELLSEIDEPFSLYVSAEDGRGVYGLRLVLKDAARASALITTYEERLPRAFQPLFYGPDVTVPATTSFKPSPQRSETRVVRYHNFRLEPTNVSFDYTVAGTDWYIGTTQAMFRILLDKVE